MSASIQKIPTPAATPMETHNVEFRGEAGEFFRIWIVNSILTILTLGAYSPWAKVRSRRYIYGNTYIAGSNFEYHGQPVPILKGRLILAVAAALAMVGYHLLPLPKFVWVTAGLIVVPFLLVRGMMFNMRNTSYRNIRFGFEPKYSEAYAMILLGRN